MPCVVLRSPELLLLLHASSLHLYIFKPWPFAPMCQCASSLDVAWMPLVVRVVRVVRVVSRGC